MDYPSCVYEKNVYFPKQNTLWFSELSNSLPIPALYFLLGELPMEAYRVVHYLLKMTYDNSTTWKFSLKSTEHQTTQSTQTSQSTMRTH